MTFVTASQELRAGTAHRPAGDVDGSTAAAPAS